jgi:hypothetical protein
MLDRSVVDDASNNERDATVEPTNLADCERTHETSVLLGTLAPPEV